MHLRTFVVLGAITALPIIAFAQVMPGMNMPGPAIMEGVTTEATAAYMAAHDKMMADMHVQLTGNPDRDFVMMMMIPHHQGAIDMPRVELQYGTDPDIRAMAEAIIAAQEAEIAAFQAWLAAHP